MEAKGDLIVGHTYVDESWDFRYENTKTLTHCFHSYPAVMIPCVAERLISEYGKHASLLFDPYCGSGTSLVEANMKNIAAIGTDLNPLARLIARAKTANINPQVLDLYLKDFADYIFSVAFGMQSVNAVIPPVKNMDYWFSCSVQEQLAIIKHFIMRIEDEAVADFFKVAFSETVRESSWTKNSEFKLLRMSAIQRERFRQDVFSMVQCKLARNRRGLKEMLEGNQQRAKSVIMDFNTVEGSHAIPRNSVDIVVTSPPYGDSRTTVAYGQFSRLSNEWLDIEDASQLDNRMLGGRVSKETQPVGFTLLDDVIVQIAQQDAKRAREVAAFYADYSCSIRNVAKTLKKGGYACYVVGNRKVKGMVLPTDETTRFFFERQGFCHVKTVIRNIPNKRLPARNSPTNQAGITDTTMSREYIVVMEKRESVA